LQVVPSLIDKLLVSVILEHEHKLLTKDFFGGILGTNTPGHRLEMVWCKAKNSLYLLYPSNFPCLSFPAIW
jgi:hypothetical protein